MLIFWLVNPKVYTVTRHAKVTFVFLSHRFSTKTQALNECLDLLGLDKFDKAEMHGFNLIKVNIDTGILE